MTEVHFGRWLLSTDREATSGAYARVPVGGPEECGCEPCQNFVVARKQIYPVEALTVFDQLGVRFDREAEVYHMARLQSGKHLYGGWFHFVGSILNGADAAKPIGENLWQPDLEKIGEDFSLGFSSRLGMVPEPFRGLPLVQVEFTANGPWVISAKEPER
jgi:hypothetical protein